MKKLSGVTSYEDLKVNKAFEEKCRTELETLMPNSWSHVREACIDARDLKIRHETSKVSDIRKELQAFERHARDTLSDYENLTAASKAIIPSEIYEKLSEVVSAAELALESALDKESFPDGKIEQRYRGYLAKKIVEIMKQKDLEPKLNRDLDSDTRGDSTYAQILRIALELTDDGEMSPSNLMPIMQAGLL
jgi:5-methylcytosine-specific restriction endonuclease McrBC regulatory subunit McrC